MIPAPNLIAGILIGIASTGLIEVLLASLAWPLVFCVYVWIRDRERADVTIESFRAHGKRLLLNSPALTFYATEYSTALLTAVPVAFVTYWTMGLVT